MQSIAPAIIIMVPYNPIKLNVWNVDMSLHALLFYVCTLSSSDTTSCYPVHAQYVQRVNACVWSHLLVCVWPKNIHLHGYQSNLFAKGCILLTLIHCICCQRCLLDLQSRVQSALVPLFLFMQLHVLPRIYMQGLFQNILCKKPWPIYSLEIVTPTVWLDRNVVLQASCIHVLFNIESTTGLWD